MDILGYEFRLTFTSPLWIVNWKSKAPQKRLSNQYTCITVIVSCFRRCYKSYSLRKRWNRKIHKLQLFAEWIFALCTCAGPGGSRIFFRRWCTRLLLYFNTNKPHIFFVQNTSCIRKPQVISGGGGLRTPCTFHLDPPLGLMWFAKYYANIRK